MANNRIYLRCKGCGDTLFLGKCFGSGYYWMNYDGVGTLEEKLNKFFDAHTYCDSQKVEIIPYDEKMFPIPEGFDGCEGAYDIVYEDSWGTGLKDRQEVSHDR